MVSLCIQLFGTIEDIRKNQENQPVIVFSIWTHQEQHQEGISNIPIYQKLDHRTRLRPVTTHGDQGNPK